MAQRFPADYDGIVSVVPAIQLLMIFEAFVHHEVPQLHGGLMPPAKVAMLAKFVADRCDALDGLADGVVNNYLACPARIDLKELRCPDGADSGASCLCDAQIAVVALANGLSAYGNEIIQDTRRTHMVRWFTGRRRRIRPFTSRSARSIGSTARILSASLWHGMRRSILTG
jgi:Tannase and feruloyl esterase